MFILKYCLWLLNRRVKVLDSDLLLVTAVSFVSSLLLGLLAPKRQAEPTKLQNKDAPNADYGFAIPIGVSGTHSYQGSLFWALPLEEVLEEVEPENGGGGGKGFGSPEPTEYVYYATCAYLLAYVGDYDPNYVNGVPFGEVYVLNSLKLNDTAINVNSTYIEFYNGSYTQDPDPTIQAVEPNTPAYRGYCYVVFNRIPVKKYGNGFFSVTATLTRGSFASIEDSVDRLLRLSLTSQTSTSYYPDLTAINWSLNFSASRFELLGFRLPSSGQKYSESLDQLAYNIDSLGKITSVASQRSSETDHQDLAQATLTTLPVSEYQIGDGRTRAYTSLAPEHYTIPYRLLGASPEGDYFSTYQVEASDVTELPTEVTIRYSDPTKDYNTTELTYSQDYPVVDYRSGQSTSVSTDLVCSADSAKRMAENIYQKSYDINRQYTLYVAPSTFGNIQVGQKLIFELNETGDTVQILVNKITRGSDYTQEVQGFIYSDKLLPSSGAGYGYPDFGYDTLPTLPPQVSPDTSLAATAFKVYDLPFVQSTPTGKLGLWLAINDPTFVDGTVLSIWYKVGSGVWVNSGQTISAKGKFGTATTYGDLDYSAFHSHFINTRQPFDIVFDNPAYTLATLNDTDFAKRLGNLAIIADVEGTSSFNGFVVSKTISFSGGVYTLSEFQSPNYNAVDFDPSPNNYVFDDTLLLFYGTGRQTWFSLPTSAIGQTVSVAVTDGDPSGVVPKTTFFGGKSYQAPHPTGCKSYRQSNGDWLLVWSAVDIYEQVWQDSSDSTLDSPQFYTIDIAPSEFSSNVRTITTTTLSATYTISQQTTDGLQNSSNWYWRIRASYSGYTTGRVSLRRRAAYRVGS